MAVVQIGATPILVEPSMLTYNIDPYEVEKAITPKTKAILVVHLYGQACEMDALQFVAKLHDIPLVEDNAQAHGARFMGQLTGSFGQINATSFYPTKNLGALGDAGAITTSDEHLYRKAKTLRNYGSLHKYHYDEVGFNSRMDEIQASILETKLGLLDQWTLERVQIANNYSQQLKLVEQIVLPNTHPKSTHVYHLYTIRTHLRDQLKSFLHERGVETAIHYPIPPHLQPAYTFLGYGKGDLPITEEISDTTLSLPLYIGLCNQQIDEICQLIFEFFKKV
jgi:dTDP-4-amino-4,6-dideoxygalactose transaminase